MDRLAGRAARKKKKKIKEKETAALQQYIRDVENLPIDEHTVILEARNGRTIDGNLFYMLRELLTREEYRDLKIYVTAFDPDAENSIRQKTDAFSDGRITIVLLESPDYYRVMATARYILNDSAIRNFYIKKEGQIYLNVWHGTPLKTMGRKVSHEPHATGSVQKNFIIADYLLYPSRYMMEHMIEDYMISDLSRAKILLGGYPRNTAFYDEASRGQIRTRYGLDGKRVYAYMPTWRPEMMGDALEEIMRRMDQALTEDEILCVNIHPLAEESVDLGQFSHIMPFPKQEEVYAFLNAADCLVTDYSSVFYDFAVTGRKIVLYTYDEEEYFRTRGLYEPISSLPFDQVKTVEELMEAVRAPKVYDDADFLRKYCPYEGPDAARLLTRQFILGEENLESETMPENGLPNILVYGGDLAPGARTDQVMEYLADADKPRANYYLVFNKRDLTDHKEILMALPDGIRYYGRTGKRVLMPDQMKAEKEYKEGRLSFDDYWKSVRPAFARERIRYFGGARIDGIVEIPDKGAPGPEHTKEELEFTAYV